MSSPEREAPDALPAAEAARYLGVKRATLYAYASRGLLCSVAGRDRRARLYLRADLDRLRERAAAETGGGDAARSVLRFGEPILESAISAITARGPLYRGRLAVELAADGTPFESVAELLFTGALPAERPRWRGELRTPRPAAIAALACPPNPPHALLALLVPALAALDLGRADPRIEAALPRARGLILGLAGGLALWAGRRPIPAYAVSVAARVARALGARGGSAAVGAIEQALVLVADHELNTSTFAARVAASAGADIYACTSAALGAFSGPKHGGACDRIEALVAEVKEPRHAARVIAARLQRGEPIPGFGHPLYPGGDPRTPPLLEAARALRSRSPGLETLLSIVGEMRCIGQPPPTVDLGLVAVAAATGLPPGAAGGVFAVGRTAGWIAHALEQRAAGPPLRPRARYVGR